MPYSSQSIVYWAAQKKNTKKNKRKFKQRFKLLTIFSILIIDYKLFV
jgi:hypothetical protein